MQRIERYGVIALVFLLVTILAVSLWGESKDGGFFSMFKSKKPTEAALEKDKPIRNRPNAGGQAGERMLPLATPETLPTAGGAQAPLQLGPDGQPLANTGAPAQPVVAGGQVPLTTPLTTPATTPATTPLGTTPNPLAAVRGPGAPVTLPNSPTTLGGPVVRHDTPVQAATRDYVVKSGDTLGEIASRELGSSARWVDIQRLNKMIEPKNLKVGMTLQLPTERGASVAQRPKSEGNNGKPVAPKTTAGGKYTVVSGDTLGAIASRELGSAGRWTEIRDLNPGVDPDRLKVGTALAMPSGSAPKVAASTKSETREFASLTPPSTGKKKSRVQ